MERVRAWSAADRAALEAHWRAPGPPSVVVTHFPPLRTGTSAARYLRRGPDCPLNRYFAWEDAALLPALGAPAAPVPLWVSGHTHHAYDFVRGDTRFLANPAGYRGEGVNTKALTADWKAPGCEEAFAEPIVKC